MAVGPVFFTIAMVLCVLCWQLPPAAPRHAACSRGSWQLLREAGRVLASPESRGGRLFGLPSAWPALERRTRAVDVEADGLQGTYPTPTGGLGSHSEASIFVRGASPEWLACLSLLHTTAFVIPSSPRALQKTRTSSAAARCDFLQSSSRQHMHCMQSLSHREGTASSATARRRTPSWAL